MMQCETHPEVPASSVCTRCDRILCLDCVHERNNRQFCEGCADFLDQRAVQRPLRPAPAVTSTPPVSRPTQVAAASPDPYTGADANGVYQGPGADFGGGGQRPQGPQVDRTPADPAAATAVLQGTMGKAIGFAAGAAFFGVLIWYGVAAVGGVRLRLVAIGVGWLVGFAAAFGAGRGGRDVGLAAVGIAVVAMLVGDFLIDRRFWMEMGEPLGFGEYLSYLPYSIWLWVFFSIGVREAYRVARHASA